MRRCRCRPPPAGLACVAAGCTRGPAARTCHMGGGGSPNTWWRVSACNGPGAIPLDFYHDSLHIGYAKAPGSGLRLVFRGTGGWVKGQEGRQVDRRRTSHTGSSSHTSSSICGRRSRKLRRYLEALLRRRLEVGLRWHGSCRSTCWRCYRPGRLVGGKTLSPALHWHQGHSSAKVSPLTTGRRAVRLPLAVVAHNLGATTTITLSVLSGRRRLMFTLDG